MITEQQATRLSRISLTLVLLMVFVLLLTPCVWLGLTASGIVGRGLEALMKLILIAIGMLAVAGLLGIASLITGMRCVSQ